MSTHVVFDIDGTVTELTQDFINLQDRKVLHVAPKLLINNDPTGTFTIELKEGATVIGTKSHTSTSINTSVSAQLGTAEAYKAGYFLFTFDDPINLKRNKTYTIRLSTSGYTFSPTSSIGWIKEYVNETNQLTDTPIHDGYKALSYRLWGYENER